MIITHKHINSLARLKAVCPKRTSEWSDKIYILQWESPLTEADCAEYVRGLSHIYLAPSEEDCEILEAWLGGCSDGRE